MMWSWLINKAASLIIGSSALWKWVGVGIVSVALFVLWLLWSKAELKAEVAHLAAHNAALESANQTNLDTIETLRASDAAKDAALAVRDEEYRKINAKASEFRRLWLEAKRNDPTVRDWADTPVPAPVRGLFK